MLQMGAGHDRNHPTHAVRARWVWSVLFVVVAGAMFVMGSTWGDRQERIVHHTNVFGMVSERVEVGCGVNRCVSVTVAVQRDGTRRDVALGAVAAESQLGRLEVGGKVMLGYEPSTGQYFYSDIDRRDGLFVIGIVFVLIVGAFGRWRGLRAVLGLAFSAAVLVLYTAPSIIGGADPVIASAATAIVIAVVGTMLTHGRSGESAAAILSIVVAILATLGAGAASFAALRFTGAAGDEALLLAGSGIDLRGLLLGGTILGALGALDDVAITQVAAYCELRQERDVRGAVAGAMRVGRDHVAAGVNTLLLAYCGASMPLLLLVSGGVAGGVNREQVAVELVRGLVGSVGLVLVVPVATLAAAFLLAVDGGHDEAARDGA